MENFFQPGFEVVEFGDFLEFLLKNGIFFQPGSEVVKFRVISTKVISTKVISTKLFRPKLFRPFHPTPTYLNISDSVPPPPPPPPPTPPPPPSSGARLIYRGPLGGAKRLQRSLIFCYFRPNVSKISKN